MSAESPNGRAGHAPVIDIVRESLLWEGEQDVDATLARAIAEASAGMSTNNAELAIVLTDDSSIRALNHMWRGLDKPTNVLSFPAEVQAEMPGAPVLLGDIVIAYETSKREADEQATPFLHHLAHLTVHGFLHLYGYDHKADDEAETMERLEGKILARMQIPDPYAARDAG